MDSNLTTCFWGPEDGEKFLADVKSLLGPQADKGAFAGDNLIAFGRNLSFLRDEEFINAFQTYVTPENYTGWGIIWRLYMFSWAAKSCLNKPGDFVECGVSTGASSAIMCKYLNFAKVPKALYLYDTWGGDERVNDAAYGFDRDTYRNVTARFAPYHNVILVRGYIPTSFSMAKPERIAFLHIDLNNANAEIATLNELFDRVVPGGIVLFDDYGFSGYSQSKHVEDEWMKQRGYTIAELPTGQGLLIK